LIFLCSQNEWMPFVTFSYVRICTIVFRTTRLETFSTMWRLDDDIFFAISYKYKQKYTFNCHKVVTSKMVVEDTVTPAVIYLWEMDLIVSILWNVIFCVDWYLSNCLHLHYWWQAVDGHIIRVLFVTWLHFAWVEDHEKCIVVMRVCVSVCLSVCLSVAACPHYCTDPDVTWGSGRGCPLVVHYWANLQLVHGMRCYGNIMEKGP